MRAGMGDVTAGAVDCASFFTWPPNIFNPQCYSITAAKLWGDPAAKAAAYGATSPDVMYPTMPAPAAVPPGPPPDALTVPPASGAAATNVVDEIVNSTKAAQDAAFLNYFSQVSQNIQDVGNTPSPGISAPWWLWLALGLGGFVLVKELV